MREMKDSGIEGVDFIPCGWDRIQLEHCASIIRGGSPRPIEKYMSDTDEGYSWIKIGDTVKGSKYITSIREKIIPAGLSKTRFVKSGTLLLTNSMSFGEPYILSVDGCIHDGWLAFSDLHCVDKEFLYYYLISPACRVQFEKSSDGGVVQNLNIDKVKHSIIYYPSMDEQLRIVAFLDSKCAEIDALSADIQSEIEILETYKRSVITEAVTKGLDKNVPMKNSGTHWLGYIPSHWNISRIGSVYKLRNTKVSDKDFEPLSVTMKGIVPQLDSAAKTNAHDDRKLVRKGDFAINSRSDRRGSCGISPFDGSVSLINTVLAPLDEMNPEYYNWLFHTIEFADEFYKWGHGIVDDLWTTGWQDMKRILIPYPLLEEQEEIANYLNSKCSEIDAVLVEKQAQLAILADYKKSVIYEYVTGKKEVPDGNI